jgi:hypothetical protein
MNIAPAHLASLKALGYTEIEARFLYIVATHSGYFVARQFLAFTGAHWGQRTTNFWSKLHDNKHARTECFPKSGTVYHLFARRLYRQIDRENIRNRRDHEIDFIQRRIGMLDFVLSHLDRKYLETEQEKVGFFCNELNIPRQTLPARIYHSQRSSEPTVRHFVDKFPMFLQDADSPPVVTFTYLQGAESSLTEFVRHLEDYRPLFRHLAELRFRYLARFDFHFKKAQELFNSVIALPLGSDPPRDLLRYFQISQAWDQGRYASLTEADIVFRNQSRARFAGHRFENLYSGWALGNVAESDIRREFKGNDRKVRVQFDTELLSRRPVSYRNADQSG